MARQVAQTTIWNRCAPTAWSLSIHQALQCSPLHDHTASFFSPNVTSSTRPNNTRPSLRSGQTSVARVHIGSATPGDSSLLVDHCHAVCYPLDSSFWTQPVPQQPAASSNIRSLDLETRSGTHLHWLTGAAADLGTRAPAYEWLKVETHYFQSCSSASHNTCRLPKSGHQPLASVSRGALRSNPCSLRPLIGPTPCR